ESVIARPTRSRRWIWPSTAACARAISRSPAPRRAASLCWTPPSPRTRCTRPVCALSRSSSSVGRPRVALEAIRDQAEAVDILRRAIDSRRVAHAYAFIGPTGVGRRTTALAFAKALVAPSGGATAARVDRGLHPDVHVIGPTPPATNPNGVPAVRVGNVGDPSRRAALRAAEAAHKVFIVDEPESMTGAPPQAFLKTLEEPPARTVIILILSQARALPATVLSRCQIVRFRPRAAEGVALLPSGAGADRERALGWLGQAQSRGPEGILQIGEAGGRPRDGGGSHRDLLALVS